MNLRARPTQEMNVPYPISCPECKQDSWASDIVDLITRFSTSDGTLRCPHCGAGGASIYRESALQEKGEQWRRWIKGVIRIDSDAPTYCPYVFLTAQEEGAPVDGLHFNYYKDTRSSGGRLKHGHGPGGAPVLTPRELMRLVERLIRIGVFSTKDVERLALVASGRRDRKQLPSKRRA